MSAYKGSFIDNAELKSKEFGSSIFCSWQMTIEDRTTAKRLKTKIAEDLLKLFEAKSKNQMKTGPGKEYLVYRLVFLVGVVGVIGGTCYGIYELLRLDQAVYVVPIILSFIVVFIPWILNLLKVFQYPSPSRKSQCSQGWSL